MNRHAIRLCVLLLVLASCGAPDSESTVQEDKEKAPEPAAETDSYSDMHYPEVGNYTYNTSFFQAYDKALQLFDVKMKQMDIDTPYGTAHVIECGNREAETLVFLHGMNATSTMWYPNIKSLSEDYHIYMIDFLLEPGKSKSKVKIENLSQVIRWYDAVFEQLHITEASLIGASRGGWLSVNLALNSKLKVRKLALLSPAQTFVWMSFGQELVQNLRFTVNPKRKKLRELLTTLSSNVDNIDQTYIDMFYLSFRQAKFHKALLDMRPFPDQSLSRLQIPVLLLIGDDDFINAPRALDQARQVLPNLTAHVVPQAGHFLSMDQPEAVNAELIAFLQK